MALTLRQCKSQSIASIYNTHSSTAGSYLSNMQVSINKYKLLIVT